MSRYHPELKKGEQFLGNVTELRAELSHLKTIRLGDQAYFLDGKNIPKLEGYRPLIIGDSEFDEYDRIMMKSLRAIRGGANAG